MYLRHLKSEGIVECVIHVCFLEVNICRYSFTNVMFMLRDLTARLSPWPCVQRLCPRCCGFDREICRRRNRSLLFVDLPPSQHPVVLGRGGVLVFVAYTVPWKKPSTRDSLEGRSSLPGIVAIFWRCRGICAEKRHWIFLDYLHNVFWKALLFFVVSRNRHRKGYMYSICMKRVFNRHETFLRWYLSVWLQLFVLDAYRVERVDVE